jgi:hypothetical protein
MTFFSRMFARSPKHRRNILARQHHSFERLECRILFAVELNVGIGNKHWTSLSDLPTPESGLVSFVSPTSFSAWTMDRDLLSSDLALAPLEFTPTAIANPLVLQLPTPSGDLSDFYIYEAPIMEPSLAAEFPEIRTYRGQGIDDPTATLRLSITPFGFHAQVLATSGAYYIDPYWHMSDLAYVSYFKRDLTPREDWSESEPIHQTEHLPELVEGLSAEDMGPQELPEKELSEKSLGDKNSNGFQTLSGKPGDSSGMARSGAQLRTYRLANAATGEYTQFHGGTVAAGQAAIVTTINRVVGIYEKELAVRLVLVANNSSLVYTNPNTDPYSNNDGSALLSQNQTNVDSVIGNANYDIGHVFSTGGGGLAALGVVGVTGQKARGQTGSGAPVGDPFDVDYVAHEIGHQFGGSHTFNGVTGSCSGNRMANGAYEPGSGSTIMSYAGICGADNLQTFSDPYFHSISFDEIVALTRSGTANAAATITNTGNSVPRVYAGRDFTIPTGTPFALNAISTDADSGNVLTHSWEQRDLGPGLALSGADNGTSPLFRSWNPTIDPSRTFPRLSNLLNNTTPIGERLPTTNRFMNFRASVRDNFGGGGGVNTDDMRITVVNTGAPFTVTSPNSQVSYAANSQQTVTWNVAGTSGASIGVSQVDIWLSVDGGLTFPILLAGGTANDGTESVVMPDTSTNQARIKVEARDNIFFDVSNVNFSITNSSNTVPTISAINNVWIPWNTSTSAIPFQIGDNNTPSSNLIVAAFAANQTLIPTSRIQITGTGANRAIQVRPALGVFGDTQIYVGVTDANGVTRTETFTIYVEPIFACQPWENFDAVSPPAMPSGWLSSSTSGSNTWTTSATTSHLGPNNAFSPNVAVVSDTQLTSPQFTVTQESQQVRFFHSYNLENTYDGGVLEISVDGGSFVDMLAAGGQFLAGGYVSTLSTAYSNPIGGRSAWTGNSAGYRETSVQLPSSSLGKQVRLRWRLGTDSSVNAPGWRVDSIERCGFPVPRILSIEPIDSAKNEGNSETNSFLFSIVRTGNLSTQLTVNYSVSGSGLNPADASDFGGSLPSGTLTIPANATSAELAISVQGDALVEPNEGFRVVISSSTNETLIDNSEALGLILNDDQSTIVNRNVFYGASNFAQNGVSSAIDPSKQLAVEDASAKTLSYENLINTTRGINGLVFDLANVSLVGLNASDFVFQWSPQGAFNEAANPQSSWGAAPNPSEILVSSNGTGSRVTLSWPNNVIENRWLRTSVLANANTGLAATQVFYLGHLRGEVTGAQSGQYIVNNTDASAIASRVSGTLVPVSNIYDLDKNTRVLNSDIGAMSASIGVLRLRNITIPAASAGRFRSNGTHLGRTDVLLGNDSLSTNATEITPDSLKSLDSFFSELAFNNASILDNAFETNRRRGFI